MTTQTKEKKSHIGIVFLIYMAILLIAMVLFLRHVNSVLVVYEASQPEHAIAAVADTLAAEGIGSNATVLLSDLSGDAENGRLPYTIAITDATEYSVYDTAADHLAELNAEIAANGVQYLREMEDFTTGAIRYSLYSGEHRFAETSLLPGESETRLKLLTITQWVPQEIRLLPEDPQFRITATLPEGYSLQLNGIAVSDDCRSGQKELSGLDYCRAYVEIPDQINYEINNLHRLPEVCILDQDASVIAEYSAADPTGHDGIFSLTGSCLNISLAPSESEMPEDRKALVLDAVKTYSLFFSKDLPGAQGSINPIRHLFPADSEYLSLAEEYRRNSMGYYDSHTKTHFVTEEVDHYIEYSEDCFCCHVFLEKSMTIWGSREVIDTTDGMYYFVNIDGNWVIADIK